MLPPESFKYLNFVITVCWRWRQLAPPIITIKADKNKQTGRQDMRVKKIYKILSEIKNLAALNTLAYIPVSRWAFCSLILILFNFERLSLDSILNYVVHRVRKASWFLYWLTPKHKYTVKLFLEGSLCQAQISSVPNPANYERRIFLQLFKIVLNEVRFEYIYIMKYTRNDFFMNDLKKER